MLLFESTCTMHDIVNELKSHSIYLKYTHAWTYLSKSCSSEWVLYRTHSCQPIPFNILKVDPCKIYIKIGFLIRAHWVLIYTIPKYPILDLRFPVMFPYMGAILNPFMLAHSIQYTKSRPVQGPTFPIRVPMNGYYIAPIHVSQSHSIY
jgi:hypothetical protein